MRESRTYGSVRGARGDSRPYRDVGRGRSMFADMSGSRFGSCSFLNQADLGAATFENDVRRDRSSDLDETQGITIESQPLIELRDINRNGVVHG